MSENKKNLSLFWGLLLLFLQFYGLTESIYVTFLAGSSRSDTSGNFTFFMVVYLLIAVLLMILALITLVYILATKKSPDSLLGKILACLLFSGGGRIMIAEKLINYRIIEIGLCVIMLCATILLTKYVYKVLQFRKHPLGTDTVPS